MCGITGLIDFERRNNQEILKKMTSSLSHRGPDGEGFYYHETSQHAIGLGHRRLSIIDLSVAANQPMHFEGLHVMFNGEIYNYNEIRNELISLGHHFVTHSDTEVILHGWKQWGEKSIEKWRGMFAIVMYDEHTNELICIRDRAGVKPFYYYFNNNLFLFGSELKALMAHPGFLKELDPNAAASFFQYGYVASPHSIFKNVQKLPAGYLLRLHISTSEITLKQYWNVYDYYNRPKISISLQDAIKETEKILSESFAYRLVADVPVGVFLSGGYDSSCVTALLQKERTEKIKTFTIGTTDKKLDEAPFAKMIAQHLGTDHTEYYCTAKETVDIIPELPYYYDEPFADPSSIPTILVSRLARQKVTVALSSDAGDEIFAGYNRYDYMSRYGNKLKSIPSPIRKIAAAMLKSISSEKIPYFRGTRNFHSRYDKLKNLLNNPSPTELLKSLTQVFNNNEIKILFKKPVTELKTLHTNEEMLNRDKDLLSYMMAIDYQTYMVDDILQKVDRATMSTSLEGREPYLDQKIIEWVAQLPSEYKYHNGQKKYILKKIVHKYIPKKIMERPKMGFGIPIETWLTNELKPLIYDYLSPLAINRHGLLNADEVQKLVDAFLKGRKEKYLQVWHMLMFQMWYSKWFL